MQCLSIELVGCINKTLLKSTLKQEKESGSTNTGVRRVDGTGREVKDIIGNTLSIEGWEFSHACFPSRKGIVFVGGPDLTSVRMPVNVKKFASIAVTFAGTMKSEIMSGSPAIAICMMANEETSSSEKNVLVKLLEAMEL